MQETPNNTPSPYYQAEDSVALFKLRILQHLEMLRMPKHGGTHDDDCSRDCHLIERNHTIEAIKHFISNVESAS